MEITDEEMARAEAAMEAVRARGHAVAARHDTASGRLVVSLHNGIELAVPTRLVEGLAGADAAELAEIEVSFSGLGLHWPRLDADVSVPGLLGGALGSRAWMAAPPDARGGRTSTSAEAAAPRANGREGDD